jgi:tetratricopeptide (TPR) repeat protein
MNESDSGIVFLRDFLEKSKFKKLKPFATKEMISFYLMKKDYQKALDWADRLEKDFPNSGKSSSALYSKAIIFKYFKEDTVMAKEIFKKIIDQYPDAMEAFSARVELGENVFEMNPNDMLPVSGGNSFILQNFPNPFNPETKIRYNLPEPGNVKLVIYNILGREIKKLFDGEEEAGSHIQLWDGKDKFGQTVTSGVYIYQLRYKDKIINKKLLMMK